jgi:hypothetical protein
MAVLALNDIVRCPTCGGSDIVYTCEPKCCFNHLCADCRTTFQLVTRKTGRVLNVWSIAAEEPPSGDPTAACSACESLALAVLDEEGKPCVVCASCHTALELAYEDIAAEA